MSRIRADRRVGLLLGGVIVLTFVALGASVALPATDPDLEAEPRQLSAEAVRGMEVYRSEGCWYCHSQYVRDTRTDSALGEPLGAEAYAGRSPSMLGVERIGGDLTYPQATQAQALVEAVEGHGSGPPYAYLSDQDIQAVAAYLLSLAEQ